MAQAIADIFVNVSAMLTLTHRESARILFLVVGGAGSRASGSPSLGVGFMVISHHVTTGFIY